LRLVVCRDYHTLSILQVDYENLDPKFVALLEIIPMLEQIDEFEEQMRRFEITGSDPNRLFVGPATGRLEEERFRLIYAKEYPKLLKEVRICTHSFVLFHTRAQTSLTELSKLIQLYNPNKFKK
jgi:hypothetical protein